MMDSENKALEYNSAVRIEINVLPGNSEMLLYKLIIRMSNLLSSGMMKPSHSSEFEYVAPKLIVWFSLLIRLTIGKKLLPAIVIPIVESITKLCVFEVMAKKTEIAIIGICSSKKVEMLTKKGMLSPIGVDWLYCPDSQYAINHKMALSTITSDVLAIRAAKVLESIKLCRLIG